MKSIGSSIESLEFGLKRNQTVYSNIQVLTTAAVCFNDRPVKLNIVLNNYKLLSRPIILFIYLNLVGQRKRELLFSLLL